MKKFVFWLSIILLFPFFSISQTNNSIVNPGAPEITFETKTIDYGTIKNLSDGDREFKFKNTGTRPLVISQCLGSCGCTVPRWPIDSIKPGEEGIINVHYATDRLGPIDRTITVYSNSTTGIDTLRIIGLVKFTKPSPSQYSSSKDAKIFNFFLTTDSATMSEQTEKYNLMIDYIKLATKDHKRINLFIETSTMENPNIALEENYKLSGQRAIIAIKTLNTTFRSNKLTPYVLIKDPIILVQGKGKDYLKRKSKKYKYVKIIVDNYSS